MIIDQGAAEEQRHLSYRAANADSERGHKVQNQLSSAAGLTAVHENKDPSSMQRFTSQSKLPWAVGSATSSFRDLLIERRDDDAIPVAPTPSLVKSAANAD